MKTKSLMFIMASLLAVALIASSCGGGKATTSTSPKTTTTSQTTATSSQATTTTTKATTTTGSTTTTTSGTTTTTTTTSPTSGGTLPDTGIAITTHNQVAMKAYTGLCLLCHGQNMSNAQPYPPTWDGKAYGSVKYPGVYTVAPGSKADHTGYTNATDCLQANCHAAPTA